MKNKKIEEILNELKDKYSYEPYDNTGKVYTTISYEEGQLLLSYIEQLEKDYKEANESVIWWQNRYNAIVKQNDNNHKKIVKLENNRDKAIEILGNYKHYSTPTEEQNRENEEIVDNAYNILKGDIK